ncbi:MAG: hypothetical protein ACKVWV_07760 [Planctomycetota bacterium]
MTSATHALRAALLASLAALSACSSGSSSDANAIAAAIQDLTLDPDGTTTVVTFASTGGLAAATTANFEADGGQTAQTVAVNGDEVTITWDERVTPSHEVRAVGLSGVTSVFYAVTTSDDSAPTFAVTDAIQNPALGGDTIEVTFSGVNVVEDLVEDPANWTLTVNGADLDLTGSTFTFDSGAQILDVTLGSLANLHATFALTSSGVESVADVAVDPTPVNGLAAGDNTPPSLVTAEQNLTEDEFGRVVDFTFDEAMDPVFSLGLARYQIASPGIATSVEQPSDEVLRVTFSAPVIPAVDDVTLTGLLDLHGNAFPLTVQAITQPSPVVNAYDGAPAATTVQGTLGDFVEIVTTQGFDEDSAEDPANWTVVVDGNSLTMADQTLEYDLLTKTLTIALDFDMKNGDAFTVTAGGVLEVDGQNFALALGGTVSGDVVVPTVASVVQNRDIDDDGLTLDVTFSETLDEATAETTTNYTISGAQNLVSATLLPSLDKVQLVFDAPVVPGDVTLDVDAVEDLAGNAMTAAIGLALTSTDSDAPQPLGALATAVEGAFNDTLVVTFDDAMLESGVETPASWIIESPIGNPIDTTGATVVYDTLSQSATLTLANGVNLKRGDDFQVEFADMSDVGGNTVTATVLDGDVDFETTLPRVHTIYRESSNLGELVVRFTEPCEFLDDIGGETRYELKTNVGVTRGFALTATPLDDGLGVRLFFGMVIALTDTLDVSGVVDLAGNPMFPALAVTTVAEDTATPGLDGGFTTFTTFSGENNDEILVQFDRPMSPWNLLDISNYTITGASALDLEGTAITFDGDDTVRIELGIDEGHDLETGAAYDVSVNNVWSAQGIQRTVLDAEIGIAAGGDVTAPDVAIGKVYLDLSTPGALLVEFDEAIDPIAAQVAASFDLNSGNIATTSQLLGRRNVRLTFGVAPIVGDSLDLVMTDLAGNVSGTVTRAVIGGELDDPLIVSVDGYMEPGYGGDTIEIVFDEPVDPATALERSNYIVRTGTTTLSLASAELGYDSATSTVVIALPGGQEIDGQLALTVTVSGISDFSGNTITTPIPVGATRNGDTTDPQFESAFVNYRASATGAIVDVLFSEDVDTTFAADAANWTASGGAVVTAVSMEERNHARVFLSAALGAADTLTMTGVPDLARNTSGAIQIDPLE